MPRKETTGFTLTELLTAVSILGILTAISVPIFSKQVAKTRQSEAEALLVQLQISTMAYIDEFMVRPTHWGDLSRISTILTESGPIEASTANAKGGDALSTEITIPSGKYTIKATPGNNFLFEAVSQLESHKDENRFNVIACINTENGASDVIRGNETTANKSSLTCSQS